MRPFLPVVANQGTGVVDLVGERDPQHSIIADLRQVLEISSLSLDPRLIGIAADVVRAAFDDRRNAGAEAPLDSFKQRPSAAVLDRVVQHRGDRILLIAAVLEHQAANDEQVRQIRDLGPDPALATVDLVR